MAVVDAFELWSFDGSRWLPPHNNYSRARAANGLRCTILLYFQINVSIRTGRETVPSHTAATMRMSFQIFFFFFSSPHKVGIVEACNALLYWGKEV